MPKLKNVTADELNACINTAQDAGQFAGAIVSRIEQGYCDEIPEPIQAAAAFMGASAILAEVARHLLMKAALQEQRAMLEAKLRERGA